MPRMVHFSARICIAGHDPLEGWNGRILAYTRIPTCLDTIVAKVRLQITRSFGVMPNDEFLSDNSPPNRPLIRFVVL